MSNKPRNQIHNRQTDKQTQRRFLFCDISNLILEHWPLLSHEEADSYGINYDRFCEAVQKEYGVPQEEIDRQLTLMRREVLYAA